MDFSAWFEAYVGGEWYTFDARNNIQHRPGADRPWSRCGGRRDQHDLRSEHAQQLYGMDRGSCSRRTTAGHALVAQADEIGAYFGLAAPVRRTRVIGGQLTDRLNVDCPGPSSLCLDHPQAQWRHQGVPSFEHRSGRSIRNLREERFASRSPPPQSRSVQSVASCFVAAGFRHEGAMVVWLSNCQCPGPCVITSAGAKLGADSVGRNRMRAAEPQFRHLALTKRA
jgi:hypothetical protein